MHYYKDIERRCELSIATSRLNLGEKRSTRIHLTLGGTLGTALPR